MLSRDEIDKYLQLLSEKILHRFDSEAHIVIVVAGGAAIALNYTFRQSTMDIDCYSRYSAELEDLVKEVAVEQNIDYDWLSHNMMVTSSCSSKIVDYTEVWKVYSGVLEVRTVDALTLICMKCVSCRPDSHDMEDIVHLLDINSCLEFSDVRKRFMTLYGDWSLMCADAQLYLTKRFNAMPPDMVDTVKEYLPPAIRDTLTGEDLYEACQNVYRSLL